MITKPNKIKTKKRLIIAFSVIVTPFILFFLTRTLIFEKYGFDLTDVNINWQGLLKKKPPYLTMTPYKVIHINFLNRNKFDADIERSNAIIDIWSISENTLYGGTTNSNIRRLKSVGLDVIIDYNSYDEYHNSVVKSENESETVNWETYTNTAYSFEFRYPPTWFITYEVDGEIYITSTDPKGGGNFAGFRVKAFSNTLASDYTSLQKFILDKYPYLDPNRYLLSTRIDGLPGYKLVEDAAPENIWPIQYFTIKEGVIYQIEASEDISFPERNEKVINEKILSTFKFLN